MNPRWFLKWNCWKIIFQFRAHKMNQWKWMDEPTLILKMNLLKNHFQFQAHNMNQWKWMDEPTLSLRVNLLKIIFQFRAHKMNQWKWMDEPTLILKMRLLKNSFFSPERTKWINEWRTEQSNYWVIHVFTAEYLPLRILIRFAKGAAIGAIPPDASILLPPIFEHVWDKFV